MGAQGYVGSQICRAITHGGAHRLITVGRADDLHALLPDAEIVVHAANPAKRFQASQNPQRDFEETVEKTAGILRAARGKKFILISSLSCRTQLDTVYGRHRRACELLALLQGATVVRLGPLFGGNRTRDILHDILLGNPVFVSAQTLYAYTDVAWVGRRIVDFFTGGEGIFEIGAQNAVALADLAVRFQSQSSFSGPDDTQIPEGSGMGPDAMDVVRYAEAERARIAEWK